MPARHAGRRGWSGRSSSPTKYISFLLIQVARQERSQVRLADVGLSDVAVVFRQATVQAPVEAPLEREVHRPRLTEVVHVQRDVEHRLLLIQGGEDLLRGGDG